MFDWVELELPVGEVVFSNPNHFVLLCVAAPDDTNLFVLIWCQVLEDIVAFILNVTQQATQSHQQQHYRRSVYILLASANCPLRVEQQASSYLLLTGCLLLVLYAILTSFIYPKIFTPSHHIILGTQNADIITRCYALGHCCDVILLCFLSLTPLWVGAISLHPLLSSLLQRPHPFEAVDSTPPQMLY